MFRDHDGITVSKIDATKGEEVDAVIDLGLLDDYVPQHNEW